MAHKFKKADLEKYEVGFNNCVARFKSFIKDNEIRKSRTETDRQFLLRVKNRRIQYDKIIREKRRNNPPPPKNKPRQYYRKTPKIPKAPPPPPPPTQTGNNNYFLNDNVLKNKRDRLNNTYTDPTIKKTLKDKGMKYTYELSMIDIKNLPVVDIERIAREFIYYMKKTIDDSKLVNFNLWGKIVMKYPITEKKDDDGYRTINLKPLWNYINTKNLKYSEINLDNVMIIIRDTLSKTIEGYVLYLHAFDFFISESIGSVAGGCTNNPYKSEKIKIDKYNEVWLKCIKSKNQNCLFSAINSFYKEKGFDCGGNKIKPETIREKFELEPDTYIHHKNIKDIIVYYNHIFNTNFGYILFNETIKSPLSLYNVPPHSDNLIENLYDCVVPLMLKENHYYLYEYHGKVKCKECGQHFNKDHLTKHLCSISVIMYNNKVRNAYLVEMIEKLKNKYEPEKIKKMIKYVVKKSKGKKDNNNNDKYVIDLSECDEEDLKLYYELKYGNKIVQPYYKPHKKDKKKKSMDDDDFDDDNEEIDDDRLKPMRNVFIDFEAFPGDHKEFTPYAYGYYDEIDKQYNHVYYDEQECTVMDTLFNMFEKYNRNHSDENVVMIAYNGANFDWQLILKEIVKRGYNIDYNKFILSDGRILSMKILNITFFDLYLFMPGYSLAKACESFGISDENCKGEFNHDNVKSFDDALTHKNEILPYLKKDVMGMGELYNKFYDIVRNATIQFDLVAENIKNKLQKGGLSMSDYKNIVGNTKPGFDLRHFLTISHCGYDIWRSTLKRDIHIPTYRLHNKFISKATFGGRTTPFQKDYKSKHYDEVKEIYKHCCDTYANKIKCYKEMISLSTNKKNTKALKKQLMDECFGELQNKYFDIINNSDDYIVNADVTSLYPAAMAGFLKDQQFWLKGNNLCVSVNHPVYPIGKLMEIENSPKDCEYNFCNKKMGIYEIKYTPPKNIKIPVLPSASYIGNRKCGVKWSLEDGQGMYTSVDIENAVIAGYKIEFLGSCVYWNHSSDIFGEYVDKFAYMKQQAEELGNEALRSTCKLFLNSLYGKTLQKPIISESKVINDFVEFNQFITTHHLSDVVIIDNDRLIVTGDIMDCDDKMTKPSQLGAFVTAYSRRIMLFYMMEMDASLTKHTFTYTDTDSLHVHKKYIKPLVDKGYYVNKKDAQLGLLTSDIDDNGIILFENNLGPKSYLYDYLTEKGLFDDTKKTKGIPKKSLKRDMFTNASNKFIDEVTKQNLMKQLKDAKKIHKHDKTYEIDEELLEFEKNYIVDNEINCKVKFKTFKKMLQKPIKGISFFGIVLQDNERTFNKNTWTGWNLHNNNFYPPGYKHE